LELILQHLSEAATEAQAALIAARQSNDPTLESESLLQLAAIALAQQQPEPAQQHLQTVQTLLINHDNPLLQAAYLNCLGDLHNQLADYASSEKYYSEALDLNQNCHYRAGQALNLINLGHLMERQGALEKAQTFHLEALTLAQAIGHRPLQGHCWYQLSVAYIADKKVDLAQKAINRAITLHRAIEDEPGLAQDLALLHQSIPELED
jgi:tetratricopeptide (TPR) repeat protein